MPTANLLALINDITTILDDVAILFKVATKKKLLYMGMTYPDKNSSL